MKHIENRAKSPHFTVCVSAWAESCLVSHVRSSLMTFWVDFA